MCGITGWINFKRNLRDKENILKEMTDELILRGPNEDGYFIDNNVLLGHRRLIVVDPKGGTQPMKKNINGFDYTIVYNGELYNTEELRDELKSLGYQFNSYSDTEVLLTSYIQWGKDAVKKFNGIFAFCIFDQRERKLLLGRDQLGVKPLFYTEVDGGIIFSSEIKGILKNPMVKKEINRESILELVSLGPAVMPGSGVIKGIKEIKPGNLLLIDNLGVKSEEYWNLKVEEFKGTVNDAQYFIRNTFIDAVERQLVSDVKVCTFLSGGLDSSAISKIASDHFNKRGEELTTYSIDYNDNDKFFKESLYQPSSDSFYVKKMANYLKSNHKNIVLKEEELANALYEATVARDLPGMADIDSSLYLFSKEIKKDFVVALSGECADEIFGGYPWFTNKNLKEMNVFPWMQNVDKRCELLNSKISSKEIEEFVRGRYLDTIKEAPILDTDTVEEKAHKRLSYLNLKWFMVTLLTRKDRMTMANSLEVRVPFADIRLVEYAYNLPSKIKLLEGREKGLLRKSLEGILPDEIIYRKKSPYPKTYNPRYTDIVSLKLQEIINNPNSPILEIFNKNSLQELISSRGTSYTVPWYGQLMSGPQLIAYLISIDIWIKKNNLNIII